MEPRKVMKDIPGNIKKKTVRGVKKVGKTRKLESLKKKKVQTLKAKENVKDKIQYAKVLHDKQKQAEKVKVENQRNELTETLLATLFNEVKAGRRSLKISGLDDLIEEATNSHGFKGEILSALMKEKSFRHRVIDMVAEEIK